MNGIPRWHDMRSSNDGWTNYARNAVRKHASSNKKPAKVEIRTVQVGSGGWKT